MNANRLLPLLCLAFALPAAAQQAPAGSAMSALQSGAANPDCSMGGVTGEACGQASAVSVDQGTGTAKAEIPMTKPAMTHQATDVPSPTIKQKLGSYAGGVADYFKPDEVKGGTALGAAIGMLLMFGGPVGLIGGALIGAAVGAILTGGLLGTIKKKIGKLL